MTPVTLIGYGQHYSTLSSSYFYFDTLIDTTILLYRKCCWWNHGATSTVVDMSQQLGPHGGSREISLNRQYQISWENSFRSLVGKIVHKNSDKNRPFNLIHTHSRTVTRRTGMSIDSMARTPRTVYSTRDGKSTFSFFIFSHLDILPVPRTSTSHRSWI